MKLNSKEPHQVTGATSCLAVNKGQRLVIIGPLGDIAFFSKEKSPNYYVLLSFLLHLQDPGVLHSNNTLAHVYQNTVKESYFVFISILLYI